ncbi:VWA domain-containing protein [Muriicola jejuensis]|uniref:VWA domain-containing protein n=1 Tax=Muriicola jejuensis TaxID=504488 RepID=A0A6P0UHE2_9FLAO|nr:VWA domain-containing protein [Muriicola jejuensis]NER11228.1 VWA domain-containing protein [Muriicola jejuensis]
MATFLGVLLAALFSALLVWWQYYFRAGKKGRITLVIAILRFFAVFGLLLLLLNPEISKKSLTTTRQNLILLFDDSKSIDHGGAADKAKQLYSDLRENSGLTDRFNILSYAFGEELKILDSLGFRAEGSDLSGAMASMESIYGRDKSTIILVSDGNQTLGKAYEYMGPDLSFPVYSVAVGDTTRYTDLKINRVNLNKYAFLKNTFPLEIFVSYQGSESISSRLRVRMDGKTVFERDVSLGPEINSTKITTDLRASEVGLKTLLMTLDSIPGERNTVNNLWRSPIEVIDEQTRIGIVSGISHPDIGAITKAIESNEQRRVTLLKPQDAPASLVDFDMLILYQPDRTFEPVYEFLLTSGLNTFTVAGPDTDWRFLNGVQKGLQINSFNQTEEILPLINPAFGLFDISDFSVEEFPPLRGILGEILITKQNESILEQQIRGVDLREPLLSVLSDNEGRHALLFGENLWKWRLQSFVNDRDFENFDRLIDKLVLYLTSDGKRDRLTVSYEQVYNVASERSIKAALYDATFVFDPGADLKINVRGTDNEYSGQQNMVLTNNQYEADLSDLPPGKYAFSVTVADQELRSDGRFRIEDFNLEKLFVSSDYRKLQTLSEGSGGKLFYPDQLSELVRELLEDTRFAPTQKSTENIVSLIDFKILLGCIVLALTAEWFIRKYNGLI